MKKKLQYIEFNYVFLSGYLLPGKPAEKHVLFYGAGGEVDSALSAVILAEAVKTNDIFLLFVCKWHFLLFWAGSVGSWNMSRRGVPKIRKINDANFLLDIGMKSFYSESKASDVCPEA